MKNNNLKYSFMALAIVTNLAMTANAAGFIPKLLGKALFQWEFKWPNARHLS